MAAGNSRKPSSSSGVFSRGQRTRLYTRLRVEQLRFQVLDNPSLWEGILRHAIIGSDGKVDQRTACNLRLVQRSWNDDVVKILWKARAHLFRLMPKRGQPLKDAIDTFATPSTRLAPLLLKLPILGDLLRPRNLRDLSNCLVACGPQLARLGMLIGDRGHSFNAQLPTWSLPHLRKLRVILDLNWTAPEQEEEEDFQFIWEPMLSSVLLKSVFDVAPALTEVEVTIPFWPPAEAPPTQQPIFESVTLPATLTKMKLKGWAMRYSDFVEMIVRSPLPVLTSLTLSVEKGTGAKLEAGPLARILDKCRMTLKTLVLVDQFYAKPPRFKVPIRFPVMEQLESLSITSINVELGGRPVRLVETCFPKLRTLRLRHQTEDMLGKWTRGSRFTGVTTLELLLADECFPQHHLDCFLLSANQKTMQQVNRAFPNLRQLELGVSATKGESCLQYVFTEMRQLTDLKLKLFGRFSSVSLDSMLTGVGFAGLIRWKTRRNRGGASGLEEEENLRSIRNMQELASLSLEDSRAAQTRDRCRKSKDSLLLSDFTFTSAFLKMPKLKYLKMEGPFKVSDEMTEKWRSEGRSLVYH